MFDMHEYCILKTIRKKGMKKSFWKTYSQVSPNKSKLCSVIFIQNYPTVLLPEKSPIPDMHRSIKPGNRFQTVLLHCKYLQL